MSKLDPIKRAVGEAAHQVDRAVDYAIHYEGGKQNAPYYVDAARKASKQQAAKYQKANTIGRAARKAKPRSGR